MRNLQVMAFLVFVAFVFCLPAIAQIDTPVFRYQGSNGLTGNRFEEVFIYIQQKPEGYVLGGEYKLDVRKCYIQGTYNSKTGKVSGKLSGCTKGRGGNLDGLEVSGFRQERGDTFQISIGHIDEIILWRNGVKPQTSSSTNNSKTPTWSGTWVDGGSKTVISGGPNALTANFEYKIGESSGSGSWSKCFVIRDTATCEWTAQHIDNTKDGHRHGTVKATLSGNTLSVTYFEKEPEWNYHPPYNKDNVNSSMFDGATHTASLKRQ